MNIKRRVRNNGSWNATAFWGPLAALELLLLQVKPGKKWCGSESEKGEFPTKASGVSSWPTRRIRAMELLSWMWTLV